MKKNSFNKPYPAAKTNSGNYVVLFRNGTAAYCYLDGNIIHPTTAAQFWNIWANAKNRTSKFKPKFGLMRCKVGGSATNAYKVIEEAEGKRLIRPQEEYRYFYTVSVQDEDGDDRIEWKSGPGTELIPKIQTGEIVPLPLESGGVSMIVL